jgi:hypothetical protein
MAECMTAAIYKPLIIPVLDYSFSNVANISRSHDIVSHTLGGNTGLL